MIPKLIAGSCHKTLILLGLLMAGCGPLISKTPPPVSVVCPSAALAECDTSTPPVPDAMAADDVVDRLILALAQRDACAILNAEKLSCLRPKSGKNSK